MQSLAMFTHKGKQSLNAITNLLLELHIYRCVHSKYVPLPLPLLLNAKESCPVDLFLDLQSGNFLPHMVFLCCSVQEKKPLLMDPAPNIGDRNLITSGCVYSGGVGKH